MKTHVLTLRIPLSLSLWAALLTVSWGAPTNLVCIGSIDTPGDVQRLKVHGAYAYLAAGSAGLQIIDVRDPRHPVLVGNYDTPGDALNLDVSGSRVYIADGTNCLEIVDVTNPTQPQRLGGFKPVPYWRMAEAVRIVGDLAYLVDGQLQILNVTNPASVSRLCDLENVGHSGDLEILDNRVYIAGEHFAVLIFNVAAPSNPTLVGFCDGLFAQSLRLAGSYAFVAEAWTGLRVIDLTNPTQPAPVGQFPFSTTARGVDVAHDCAYVAHLEGVTALNVTNPAQPVRLVDCDTPGFANAVQVVGNYVFVADGPGGLAVLQAQPIQLPRLTITTAGTNALVRWPVTALGFVLETNSAPNNPNWLPVSDIPQVAGDTFCVSRPIITHEFYRLRAM